MKDNNMNGIKRPILAKCMYFFPCINLNDIANNATTKIELVIKKEMKDANTTNLTLQQGWNWKFTWKCKENNEPNDNNELERERYQYRTYNKPNIATRVNWKFTWICKEKNELIDNNETRTLVVMQIYVRTYFLEQYIVVDQSLPW